MRVLATVGLPGSGKGEFANVAADLGIPVVTMGDVIRAECRDRGLDPATDHGQVAKALREENGPAAIAERSLPLVEDAVESHDADATSADATSADATSALDTDDVVLIDGVRSDVEVETFEDAFGEDFALVSVEAPFDVRADRVQDRGRDAGEDEGGESLAERDERELGFGMGEAMAMADVAIENTDTLAAFRTQARTLLTGGVDAYRERFES